MLISKRRFSITWRMTSYSLLITAWAISIIAVIVIEEGKNGQLRAALRTSRQEAEETDTRIDQLRQVIESSREKADVALRELDRLKGGLGKNSQETERADSEAEDRIRQSSKEGQDPMEILENLAAMVRQRDLSQRETMRQLVKELEKVNELMELVILKNQRREGRP